MHTNDDWHNLYNKILFKIQLEYCVNAVEKSYRKSTQNANKFDFTTTHTSSANNGCATINYNSLYCKRYFINVLLL